MNGLETEMLVQHTTLGVGKVVAVEPNAVHVFFPESDTRSAAKLRLPEARAFLRTEGLEPNAWLSGLSAFALDPKTHRYALASTWLTREQAVAQFLAIFPAGFADPAYLDGGKRDRASRWRAAHEAWLEGFGDGEGERLVAAGDVKELVKRALEVEKRVAPLHPPADVGALKQALSDEETALPFLAAVVDVLSVPSPSRARLEKLFVAAASLPVDPSQQWLVATLFLFVASPGRQVLLRPRTTCEAAERLGFDLRYDDVPSFATYDALRTASAQLLEALRAEGAKDYVDVESFLHVTASAKRQVSKVGGAAARTTKRRPRAR